MQPRPSCFQQTKALGLDPQSHIKFAAEVLQRHRGRQLDDLVLRKMPPDLREQLIGDLLPGDRHRLGVRQRRALGR